MLTIYDVELVNTNEKCLDERTLRSPENTSTFRTLDVHFDPSQIQNKTKQHKSVDIDFRFTYLLSCGCIRKHHNKIADES